MSNKWELARVDGDSEKKLNAYLEDGWEPFAVAAGAMWTLVWFRRPRVEETTEEWGSPQMGGYV